MCNMGAIQLHLLSSVSWTEYEGHYFRQMALSGSKHPLSCRGEGIVRITQVSHSPCEQGRTLSLSPSSYSSRQMTQTSELSPGSNIYSFLNNNNTAHEALFIHGTLKKWFFFNSTDLANIARSVSAFQCKLLHDSPMCDKTSCLVKFERHKQE